MAETTQVAMLEGMLVEMLAQTLTHLQVETTPTHSRMTPEVVMTPVEMLVAEKMPTHSQAEDQTTQVETLAETLVEPQVGMQALVMPVQLLVKAMQQPTPIPQRESLPQNPR